MAKVRTVAHEIPTETPAAINWLRTWDPLDPSEFNFQNDSESIREFKKRVRVYVRGVLAEYNATNSQADYIVAEFDYEDINDSEGRKIKFFAYLEPGAVEGDHLDHVDNNHHLRRTVGNGGSIDPNESPAGYHLIPPVPDQPGDGVIG